MTIVLLFHEHHGECIKVKELDSTAKDCFYSGLHEKYQPLVVHLKDKAHMTASDLLKTIQVHEEAESNLQDRGYHYSSYQSKYNAPHKSGQDKFSKKNSGNSYSQSRRCLHRPHGLRGHESPNRRCS